MPKSGRKSSLQESDAPAATCATSSGSLKLVLRVPKTVERDSTPTSKGNSESSDNESDLEPLSEKVGRTEANLEAEDSDQNEEDDISRSRKRRRKKRFRLTNSADRKRKRKAAAVVVESSSTPVPPPSVEEENEPEETEADKIVMPMPRRERLLQYTPLQLLLDYLLRLFQKRDPEEYFMFPVTDEIAPDYSSIITEPMDFYSMRVKLDKNEYKDLGAFEMMLLKPKTLMARAFSQHCNLQSDVKLICNNALAYNEPTTIYFHAAKKLQLVASHFFSQEKLVSLYKLLPFMPQVTAEEIGVDLAQLIKRRSIQKKQRVAGEHNCIIDDMEADEVIESVKQSAAVVAERLAARKHKTHLAFLNQKDDGSTMLNVLTPESASEAKEKKAVRLGDLIRLKEGTPGLCPFTEDRADLAVPITYLDYGPFSSFAPQYDSTWATLTKRDSDLLLATYGDKQSAQHAWSLRDFVKNSSKELINAVDSQLDSLTDGQHSKTVRALREGSTEGGDEAVKPDEPIDFDSLRTLKQLGLDVGFLDELEKQFESSKKVERSCVDRLEQTAMLLGDLEKVQHERLIKQPEYTLTQTSGPAHEEVEIASNVLGNLTAILPNAAPSNVVGGNLKAAMGVITPSDDIDMDLLREFIDV